MDIRKTDNERAINLLKLYKARLNKPEEKSLRKAMDKLVESLESQLFDALLDIQEFYEVTLSNALITDQPQIEPIRDIVDQQTPPETNKPKREKSKKSKKRQKSVEEPDEQYDRRDEVDQPEEPQQESETAHDEVDDDQNPWLFYEIQLNKGRKGYGFAVAGGYDKNHYEGDNGIFVTKVLSGGAAEVDGQLRIDDVIVSVNETNLDYVTHEKAVDTLKKAGTYMTLIIRRLKEEFYPSEGAHLEQNESRDQDLRLYTPPVDQVEEQEPLDDGQFKQFEVILTKRQGGGLGFSIQGGYDVDNPTEDSYVSVSKLTPGGVAEVDGNLDVNDIILMVDDESLNGLTHDECVTVLKNTGRSVKLLVGRFVAGEAEPQEPVIEKTEKRKKKKHKRDRNED